MVSGKRLSEYEFHSNQTKNYHGTVDPVSRFMYLLLEKHRATVLEFTMGLMK